MTELLRPQRRPRGTIALRGTAGPLVGLLALAFAAVLLVAAAASAVSPRPAVHAAASKTATKIVDDCSDARTPACSR